MGLVAERLHLRCFIDGVEIPVIGAKATFAEGAAATAEIQVIPSDELYDIEPRAFVTLFVLDPYDFDRDPSTTEEKLKKLDTHDIRRWKLLFAGEYIGLGFQKTASGRSAVISCVDHTNYWDFIKQHYLNFSNGGVEFFESAFMGVNLDRIKNYDVPGKDLSSNLYVWLTASKNANGDANLFLGVQRVLREMWFSVNDFYAKTFNRLRINDQIVGIQEDKTAGKLFQLQFFEKWIKNQVGGGGGAVTARDMVELLLGPVFHTYMTIPCPMFDRSGQARGFDPDKADTQNAVFAKEMISRENSWPKASLNYTVIKPDSWFFAPPSCNVIFPHQYTSLSFQRGFIMEPTRLFLRSSLIFTGTDKWLTERFYSPDFEVFNKLWKTGGYLRRLATTVLPHETFVGINPAETWQSDLSAYAQEGGRREYLANVSDYLFWKMRFGTRGLNVSGPLNLNVVPGYPGVVINSVRRAGEYGRHYVGQVAVVSHSIDQQSGGWTHIQYTGAHVHDETADFDDQGRSLEEVTARGTDGFIDNIYDFDQIGEKVYKPLFGCKSTYDTYIDMIDAENTLADDTLFADLQASLAEQGAIASSVTALSFLYHYVVQNGGDVSSFTQSVTWRPKANILEMMGVDIVQGDEAQSLIDLDALGKEDPDLAYSDGFFATAVDPTAPTTVNDTFIATLGREIAEVKTTVVPAVLSETSSGVVTTVPEKIVTSTSYRKVEKENPARYELADFLEARRAKVFAYVNSLRLRGIRG